MTEIGSSQNTLMANTLIIEQRISREKVPSCVGVPEIIFPLKDKPFGSELVATLYEEVFRADIV
jgi:hypothetical protein